MNSTKAGVPVLSAALLGLLISGLCVLLAPPESLLQIMTVTLVALTAVILAVTALFAFQALQEGADRARVHSKDPDRADA